MCLKFQSEDLWTLTDFFYFILKHEFLTLQEFLSLRMILVGSRPQAKSTATPVISFQAPFDLDHLSNCGVSFPPASACTTAGGVILSASHCDILGSHNKSRQNLRLRREVASNAVAQRNSGLTVGLQLFAFNSGALSIPQINHILCRRFFTCKRQSVIGIAGQLCFYQGFKTAPWRQINIRMKDEVLSAPLLPGLVEKQ